ncbi:hypothetical protein GQ457_05G032710 [Hibiscus cannabinus]
MSANHGSLPFCAKNNDSSGNSSLIGWSVEDFEEEIEKFEKFYLVDETHCVDKSCREFDCVEDEFRELEQNFSAPDTELKPPSEHLTKGSQPSIFSPIIQSLASHYSSLSSVTGCLPSTLFVLLSRFDSRSDLI